MLNIIIFLLRFEHHQLYRVGIDNELNTNFESYIELVFLTDN